MKETICDLARTAVIHDDNWRRHTSDCADCREVLAAVEWMITLAESTAIGRGLPAPGFLLFKAKMQKRSLAADRVALPTYAMTVISGILLIAAMAGLLSAETRVASITINAFRLLSSNLGLMAFAAAVVVIAGLIAVYIGNRADVTESKNSQAQC